MLSKIALLERARALGASVTLADVEAALAKRDVAARVAAKKSQKYRIEIWDRKSPINGVPAEQILASRTDIPPGGEVYLIYIDGKLVYFQPHPPGEAGMQAMTRDEALQIADAHVTELASAQVEAEITEEVLAELLRPPIQATASPNPVAVKEVVVVTATLPLDTPDTEVAFQLVGGQAYVEPVVGGQASHAYVFTQTGVYEITVSSAHHGATVVEVTVQ
ncbi:MAG: hypothetical protein H5U01_01220 [Clostridia bacterium]|nr:hypothetical protein [Clostridia bacterium]